MDREGYAKPVSFIDGAEYIAFDFSQFEQANVQHDYIEVGVNGYAFDSRNPKTEPPADLVSTPMPTHDSDQP